METTNKVSILLYTSFEKNGTIHIHNFNKHTLIRQVSF